MIKLTMTDDARSASQVGMRGRTYFADDGTTVAVQDEHATGLLIGKGTAAERLRTFAASGSSAEWASFAAAMDWSIEIPPQPATSDEPDVGTITTIITEEKTE